MSGLRRTSRGYPIRSKSAVKSRTISVARNVVHMPRRLSVSSTPIQRTITSTSKSVHPQKSRGSEDSYSVGPFEARHAGEDVRILRRGRPPIREADRPLGQSPSRPQQFRHTRLGDRRDECDGTVVVDSEIDPTVGRLHESAAVHGGEFERLHRHDALRRGRRYMNLRSRGFFGGERTSRCLLWSSGLASMIPTASEACARHSWQRKSSAT